MPSERSANEEHDSPGEVQHLRHEVNLAIEHSQASMMNAKRGTMAEFTRNNGRSEAVSALGATAVGQIPRGAVLAALEETPAAAVGKARDIEAEQETRLREAASSDFGGTGSGGPALPVEVCIFWFSHTWLGGLQNRVHALALRWVVDLTYLSRATWDWNILLCHHLVG